MVAAWISTPPFPVCSDPRALGLFLPWETAHPKPNGASLPRAKPHPLHSLLALLHCPRAALGVSAGGSPALSLPPLTFLELRPLSPCGTSPWGVLPCQPGKRLDPESGRGSLVGPGSSHRWEEGGVSSHSTQARASVGGMESPVFGGVKQFLCAHCSEQPWLSFYNPCSYLFEARLP